MKSETNSTLSSASETNQWKAIRNQRSDQYHHSNIKIWHPKVRGYFTPPTNPLILIPPRIPPTTEASSPADTWNAASASYPALTPTPMSSSTHDFQHGSCLALSRISRSCSLTCRIIRKANDLITSLSVTTFISTPNLPKPASTPPPNYSTVPSPPSAPPRQSLQLNRIFYTITRAALFFKLLQ